jgi:hypothetical protein
MGFEKAYDAVTNDERLGLQLGEGIALIVEIILSLLSFKIT